MMSRENRLLAEIARLRDELWMIVRESWQDAHILQMIALEAIRRSERLMPDNEDVRVRAILEQLELITKTEKSSAIRVIAEDALGLPCFQQEDTKPQ